MQTERQRKLSEDIKNSGDILAAVVHSPTSTSPPHCAGLSNISQSGNTYAHLASSTHGRQVNFLQGSLNDM